MSNSLTATIIIAALAIIIVILLIRKNRKDKKEMEQTMNEDYEKPKKHNPDHY